MALKDRARELLVAKKASNADVVALGVQRDLLKESLAARDTELEGIRMMVGAKSNFVELFKNGLEQQKTLLEKARLR